MTSITPSRTSISDRFPVASFVVRSPPGRCFEVACSTDAELFSPEQVHRRTRENFFTTRASGLLRAPAGEATVLLPPAQLKRFAGARRIYYALGTYADDAAALSAETPLERGRVFFGHLCAVCHRLQGVGGSEGPDLTHFRRTGRKRLEARGYIAEVEALLKSDQTFLVEQRPRLREVLAAKGDERLRVWLRHHLEEPRFDNPRARMPGFGHIDEETRQAIVTYLLDR